MVWLVGILAVVLVGGYFGVTAWVRGYLHGEGFRMMAGEKASALMKADGEFGAFHWAETTARVEGFSAKGYEDAAFSQLDLEGLVVEVNAEAARDGVWELRKVEAKRMAVVVAEERLRGEAPKGDAVAAGGGLLAGFLPKRFEVKVIEVNEANVRVEMGDDDVHAGGMRVEVRPEAGGRAAVTVGGGTVVMAGMPEVELDVGSGRVTPETIFVTEVKGSFMEGATLLAEGTVERSTPPVVALTVEFDQLEAEKVLPEDWRKRLTGMLSGELEVAGEGGRGGYGVRGRMDLEKGVLEALPVLDEIAKHTRTDNFRRLVLSEAWMRFERQGDRLYAPEVVIASAGLLRVEGSLTIEGSVAEGEFQVGVTPGALRWLPSAEAKVFTREEGGFRWTTVRVWGASDDLQQDLSGRLLAAAVEGTAEAVVEGVTSLLPETVKEETKGAVDAVIEQGGDVIKQGADLLRGILPFGK